MDPELLRRLIALYTPQPQSSTPMIGLPQDGDPVSPQSWKGLGLPFQPVYTANDPSSTPHQPMGLLGNQGMTPSIDPQLLGGAGAYGFQAGGQTPSWVDQILAAVMARR